MPGAFDNKANLAAMPVGSTVQVPYALTDPNWLPCLGQKVSRSLYPALSACLPTIGSYTPTLRTHAACDADAIATDGTTWVVCGTSAGTQGIQTTTDGITYTPRTTTASADVMSIIYDGVNFVAASCGVHAMYSTNGGTTWTASVSSSLMYTTGSSRQDGMAWAPTLGTVGRFCLCNSPTQFVTSDDRGVTWTARVHGIVGYSPQHICWTGTRFIATCATSAGGYMTSPDGITWTLNYWPFTIDVSSATIGQIASNGAGLVVAGWSSILIVSYDSGATWFTRALSGPVSRANSANDVLLNPSYTNGRFFVGSWSSTDLVSWVRSNELASAINAGAYGQISYKAGVYLMPGYMIGATFVEDQSKITLPITPTGGNTAGGYAQWDNAMPWIKVR